MQEENTLAPSKVVGRTWVDLVFSSFYGIAILIFLILVIFLGWKSFGSIPSWIFYSLGISLIFIPFLFERAKEDSRIYVILDEPLRMTEYRIGSKVGLEIDGFGVEMLSRSGVRRTLLKSFDKDNLKGTGSPLGEYSQFEQIRQLSTLKQLADKLEETLREDRLTSMAVGVEVEKQSKEIVDWALRFSYGSMIPNELNDALGIEVEGVELDETFEDVVG